MRHVGFGLRNREILLEVREQRHRPAMIERSIPVRDDQQQVSVLPDYPFPFSERQQRIRRVFDRVGREHEFICTICDGTQIGGLRDKLPSRSPVAIITKRASFLERALPDRSLAEIAIVEAFQMWVDRKLASAREGSARPSDLQPGTPNQQV